MGRRILLLLALTFLGVTSAAAQGTGRIAGTVTAEGRPVAGATITVTGLNRSVIADSAGRFVVSEIPAGTHTVHARLLGFGIRAQQVIVADGQTATVTFLLTRRAIQLEGIVTTGYGVQERGRLTAAVSSVQAAQIAEIPTQDPLKAIQGRVPGVEVVASSNLPGAAMNVRIRGMRSISASNEPLIVLDGIPIAGGVADFSPSNIESIEILKDAAATAIYGSRGANGVLLITSKAGGRGGLRTRFTANAYYGSQRPLQLVDMMTANEYVAMQKDAARWIGQADTTANGVLLYPEQRAAFAAGTFTDWQRAILRTGQQRNYEFGMSGVTGTTSFNIAGAAFDQDGMAIGQAYNRQNAIASVDHTMDRLRFGIVANGTRSKQEAGAGNGLWGFALSQTGFGQPYDANGVLVTRPDGEALAINPFRVQEFDIGEATRNRLFASAFSDFRLAEGLNWRVNFGPDITHTSTGRFQGPEVTSPSNTFSRGSMIQQETFAYTLDNILQFNRTVKGSHHFDLTALYGVQKQRQTTDSLSARNMPSSASLWYALQTGTVEGQFSALQEWALESFMGRLNYTFLDKYSLSAAVRRDGSSRLAEGNQWATFPSVGLAWQLGDESFMQRFDVLSSAKLRGSYGVTGNTAIAPYQTQGALVRTPYNFGGVTIIGFGPNQGNPANPNLEWEKTYQTDLGLEMGFLDDRLLTTVDWYVQNTKDLILNRTLPATTGYTSTLQNIGETKNTGIELQLSTINVRDWKGINWTSDISWARNRNEIVKLAVSDTTGCPINARPCDRNNGWFVGQPINVGARNPNGSNQCGDVQRCVWYDYMMDGIWQVEDTALARTMGACAAATPIQNCPFKPGEIRLRDVNGDGVITPGGDQMIVGHTYPKWTASFYNRVTWKDFDVSGLATFKWNYTLFNSFGFGNNSMQGRFGNLDLPYYTAQNRSNVAPAPRLNGNPVPYNSTRWYEDGSHWRIRNITVGYTVPSRYLTRLRLNANETRLYFVAQDPMFFSDYMGYDPENGTAAGAPAFRTLLLGANIGF